MLTQDQIEAIEQKMEERKYSLLNVMKSFNGKTNQMTFISQPSKSSRHNFPDPSIAVSIYIDDKDKEYKIEYTIPESSNFISTQPCNRFFNDNMFSSIEHRLWYQACLYEYGKERVGN